jgi:HlyD family secretion protein
MRLSVITLVLAALGAGGYFGYSKYVSGRSDDAFILKSLDRGSVIQTVSATGTIEPVTKVIVGSQVSGRIMKWYTDFNAVTKAGDILAEIDPDRFQTALNQAKAELALAKARDEEARVRYKDSERERKRIEQMAETAAASENELLVAKAAEAGYKAAWDGAAAGILSAQALLEAAQVDLERTVIRSPIDGVVISRTIDVGQTVAASLQAPELFIIANDLRRMQVNANVSEADIGLIGEGKPAAFTVDAYPQKTFTGRISQVRYNATIVDGVVTYVTLIEVSNDDLLLRPGMTANVTFEVAKADGVLRIPNAALRFDPQPPTVGAGVPLNRNPSSPRVFVLKGNNPTKVEIKTGLSDGAYTQLVEGNLKEGDPVITDRLLTGRGGGQRPDMTRSMRPPRG